MGENGTMMNSVYDILSTLKSASNILEGLVVDFLKTYYWNELTDCCDMYLK